MRFEEAEQIRLMLDGHWNMRMDDATADLWLSALLPGDAEITTKAVAELSKTMHYPPKIADLRERIAMLTPKMNQADERDCPTCNGDRYVLVGTRQAQQSVWMKQKGIELPEGPGMEEYAPCPDCNTTVDASFRRADGRMVEPLDPALVRERLQ